MSLRIVPCTIKAASRFVGMWHRHHRPPTGALFAIGCANADDVLVGVVIGGRPNARSYQDGATVELTRVTTDGTRNACSMLNAAGARAGFALGYDRVITYTQEGESGASLRAAGFRIVAQRPARKGWDTPSRPRDDHGVDGIARTLWEAA